MGLVLLGLLGEQALGVLVTTDGTHRFLLVLDTSEEDFVGLGETDLGDVHLCLDVLVLALLSRSLLYNEDNTKVEVLNLNGFLLVGSNSSEQVLMLGKQNKYFIIFLLKKF